MFVGEARGLGEVFGGFVDGELALKLEGGFEGELGGCG